MTITITILSSLALAITAYAASKAFAKTHVPVRINRPERSRKYHRM